MAEMTRNYRHPLYLQDLESVLQADDFQDLEGKRFLITGATGLIGTCMIDALMHYNQQGANAEIYAVGRSRQSALPRLGMYFSDPRFHFLEQDVRLPLPANLAVDYVVPLASNTHPLAYSQYPVETIEINVKGAEHALLKALECNATVLYPSSVEVYGNSRGEDDFTEDYTGLLNLANARACYPESKRLSEALCLSYMAERGVQVKIARLSRVFGPTMLASDSKASSQFINKALRGEDIVLKSKGEQLFSYTYVTDAVSAMFHIMLHGEVGVAYNIANEACNVRLKDFAGLCAEWSGKEVVFEMPTDIEQKGFSVATRAILDNARLKALGWAPKFSMREAVRHTLNILKDNG